MPRQWSWKEFRESIVLSAFVIPSLGLFLVLLFLCVFVTCEAANLDVFFFLDFGHFLVLLET